MQFKALLATLGVAALSIATPAHALTQLSDSTTGGSLFITVYDPVKQVVVVQDLGLTFSSFASLGQSVTQPGPKPFGAGAFTAQTFNINLSAFTTAGSNNADIRWFVFAGDSLGTNNNKGVVLTAPNGTGILTNTNMNGMNTQGTGIVTQFNQNCPSATVCTDVPAALSSQTWTGTVGGNFAAGADGGFGDSLAFYLINGNGTTSSNNAVITQFVDAAGNWLWSLASNGTLTYGANQAPVPLPAAAWLLLSGLLGIGAVGRRSNAARLATA